MRGIKGLRRLGILFATLVAVFGQMSTVYAAANYGSLPEGTLRTMGIYFVCGSDPTAAEQSSCCNTGTDTSATANNSGPITLSYTDTSRNRKIDVSVSAPTDSSPHPLIVFAGGWQTTPATYSRYISALVGQGFVVAALTFQNQNNANYQGVVVPDFPNEADDVKFVIPRLQNETQLQGKIQPNTPVGMIGHSDGGYVALLAGYTAAHNAGLGAVLAADGNIVKRQAYTDGKPLLWMHGSLDSIESTASSTAGFNAIPAAYKAFAEVNGADHNHYIVDTNTKFNPAVDALTAAFFKRNLSNDSSQATSLSALVKSTYSNVVTLTEHGGNTAAGESGSTSGTSSSSATPACCGSSGATTAAASNVTLTGFENALKAFNFFRSKGLTSEQSAGIVGNFILESHLDPTITNSIGAHGIAQWLGGRLTNERTYTASIGQGADSLDGQLAFVWHELETSFGNALTQLKSTNDPVAAALSWDNYYEISGNAGDAQRESYAQAVYNKYKNTPAPPLTPDATVTSSGTGSATACASSANSSGFNGYFQTDPQWANVPYPGGSGMSTIGPSGCGVTSLATVISTLSGDHSITPATLASEMITKGIPSTVISTAAFTTLPAEHGMTTQYFNGRDQFNTAFDLVKNSNGNALMIVNAGVGYWTTEGHYFVVRGLAPDGNVQVHDVGESTASHPKTDKTYTPDFMSSLQTNAYGYFVITKANA